MTEKALETDFVTMGEIADMVKMHYTALPKDLFASVRPKIRCKSEDPIQVVPAYKKVAQKKVTRFQADLDSPSSSDGES